MSQISGTNHLNGSLYPGHFYVPSAHDVYLWLYFHIHAYGIPLFRALILWQVFALMLISPNYGMQLHQFSSSLEMTGKIQALP